MLYPSNIEQKLGFDKIRDLLKEECSGPVGKTFVDKIRFSFNPHVILKLTTQTEEFQQILITGEEFPAGGFLDVEYILEKIKIPGTFMFEDEASDLKIALDTLNTALIFFKNEEKQEAYPELAQLSNNIEHTPSLHRAIDMVIDERGKIRNNASPELAKIRKQIQSKQMGLRSRMDSLLKQFKNSGFTKEDASPTIRDGRLVIPVAAEYKRQVKGLVHDASATGQTVYIEPQEALDLNNEVRELFIREKQEIIRILSKLTDTIRPHIPNLLKANFFLGMMDFIRAKAKFAQQVEAIKPELEDRPHMEWYHATHPLLLLAHRQQNKSIVPQSIRLDGEEEKRILVISGPNAGGKSITLKTAGLLQYMFQCGLLVPMVEGSKMGVFKNIFIDIGDEQSLENDLSTYSSHLTNMRFFLKNANRHSLCLIDEFGTGTEPKLGAAIAESILEQLNRKKAFGVITTHYANLKFFADRTEGLINGAMRYDVDQLQPLYELEIGQPGSSFALEIAQKIGLPQEIIGRARNKVGKKEVNIERLLGQLENEKKELKSKNQELERKQRELEKTLSEYTEKKAYFEEYRKKIMNEAKAEAAKLLSQANRKIEMAIKSIKTHQADKIVTKQIRHEIDNFKESLAPEEVDETKIDKEKEPSYEVVGGTIAVDDYVKVKGQETVGKVVGIQNKDAAVMIGELKSNIRLNRLVKISKKVFKEQTKSNSSARGGINLNQKLMEFSPNLDLRGKRVEEVLPILDDFLYNAIMFSQHNLRIVHGKGTGALRELVRKHLRTFKEIKHFEDEHADRGGAGVTLIEL
ncbi:MAG: endonuclease MutS2 [Flammeovirgaceae bacterium]